MRLTGVMHDAATQHLPDIHSTSSEHQKKAKNTYDTEPKLSDRTEQPYVAIRTQATIQQLDTVIPQLVGEVFAWLGKQGVAPSGAPFVRYFVIDMEALLDLGARFESFLTNPDEEPDRAKWETEVAIRVAG